MTRAFWLPSIIACASRHENGGVSLVVLIKHDP